VRAIPDAGTETRREHLGEMATATENASVELHSGATTGAAPTAPAPPAAGGPRGGWLRRFGWLLAAGGVLFLLVQIIPYGRSHTNPPVVAEPTWNSPQTRELAARACFDCHSNLTRWPWYSNIAPVSWLVQRDVDGGRAALNFSEWNRPQDGAGDLSGAISGGSMPPWFYPLMHPKANLSNADQQRLIAGLAATLRNSPPLGGAG
jgi:hypothetical protein